MAPVPGKWHCGRRSRPVPDNYQRRRVSRAEQAGKPTAVTRRGSRPRSRARRRAQRPDKCPALLLVRALGEHLLELIDDQHQPRRRHHRARTGTRCQVRRWAGSVGRVRASNDIGGVHVDDSSGWIEAAGLRPAPGMRDESLADRGGNPGGVGLQIGVQCPGRDTGDSGDSGSQFQQRTRSRGHQV